MEFPCSSATNVLSSKNFSCFSGDSDDSDDSDAALGTGLSLDASSQPTALTVKSEPCDQEDGLAEAKPFNGVLLQGKGEIHIKKNNTYVIYAHEHMSCVHERSKPCSFISCYFFSSCPFHRPQSRSN